MINLTGMNGKELILNDEKIEKIEEVPETVITLINGNKYIVEESIDEVINKIIEFKKKIVSGTFK
ncbi:flagellar protein FlbD [Clostridium acetobutylicum]|uniref:Flagellar protein flbD n=1 Tax=Clostridium acetobutylicum (strain ATCC 824 / DSM 792 / JCM 1419 / IAM 19013 / LMG 5710 / NBRC 13948 / NRRL B-527 / VKM B-1787 / 2291 / W) TaxID=272562 RepID=Q97H60_CLOAB|nr:MULTISPECIES: flagellar FlbD family protein [Clostridium]AAK80111.1 Flagellar protein flbD [Clostridium acetobutylicum ATCC 824]ADZ21204.1 Flagellar protein flbD [Clostridium acetobutylicum EA 2018]AEI32201.1 flagellar protein flbD [Clostridium acetobutylicum DSM 1731]AWV79464.1 endoflagellar protein [Clostridium acetobutylicum]KHD38295.1 endoflagellar protein [Clostridium acetobutylicum]